MLLLFEHLLSRPAERLGCRSQMAAISSISSAIFCTGSVRSHIGLIIDNGSSTCDIQVDGISQLVPFREVLVPSRPGRSRTLVVPSSRAVSRPRVYTFLASATALQWGVLFSYFCRIISARENTPSSQSAHFSVLVVPSRGLFSHLSISSSSSSLLSRHSPISRTISGIAANSLCVRTRSLLQHLQSLSN